LESVVEAVAVSTRVSGVEFDGHDVGKMYHDKVGLLDNFARFEAI
jgi:hypothetical protein